MKFCKVCNNILSKDTEKNILKYLCNTCLSEEDAIAEDTLMLSVSLREEQSLYKSEIYLNVSSKDNLAPLVYKNCNNCDETIIKQINVSESGEAIYVCPKCDNRFM